MKMKKFANIRYYFYQKRFFRKKDFYGNLFQRNYLLFLTIFTCTHVNNVLYPPSPQFSLQQELYVDSFKKWRKDFVYKMGVRSMPEVINVPFRYFLPCRRLRRRAEKRHKKIKRAISTRFIANMELHACLSNITCKLLNT